MSNKAFIAVMAALAVVGLLAFGLASSGTTEIAVGQPAPDAELPRLDASGEGALTDYEGKWVLVNFWASWCEPCRAEAPAIEEYSKEMSDEDLVVLGINTQDLTDDAREFEQEFNLSWEMLRDGDGSRREAWGTVALPETFLVDPEGRIALVRRGPVDDEYLAEMVTPLIEANSKRGS